MAPRYGALALLTMVYALSVLDRCLLDIVLPRITVEMALSYTSLGLISVTAFGSFYATLGLPIARLADRNSPKKVFAFSLPTFCQMTALAITIFIIGSNVGLLAGFIAGGNVAAQCGWRETF
jgi:sugar phosphate permease